MRRLPPVVVWLSLVVAGCSSSSGGAPAANGTGGSGAAPAAGGAGGSTAGAGGSTAGASGSSAGAGGAGDELAVPPKGEGLQIATGTFDVPPGTEEQDCYFYKVGELAAAAGLPAGPVNVHRIQVAQRTGSHHMNLFRVRTIVSLGPDGGAVQKGTNGMGECFKSANWADWPLIANSQSGGQQVDWTFPDGVANVLQPDEWVMLQTHFVNATTQTTPGDAGAVRVNLWSIPTSAVTAELGTVFATKQSIRVCASNPKPSFDGTCQINSPDPVTIIGANAHFHSRGREFDMYAWDGTSTTHPADSARFYQSKSWNEPPMMHSPELSLAVPAMTGVWYTCSYQWQEPLPSIGCAGLNAFDAKKYMTPVDQQDCCYTFGPQVDANEHCNIFVYYYPKKDNVFCN